MSIRTAVTAAVIALQIVSAVNGQNQSLETKPLAFDVASIKKSKSVDRLSGIQRQPGGRVTITNMTLRTLVTGLAPSTNDCKALADQARQGKAPPARPADAGATPCSILGGAGTDFLRWLRDASGREHADRPGRTHRR